MVKAIEGCSGKNRRLCVKHRLRQVTIRYAASTLASARTVIRRRCGNLPPQNSRLGEISGYFDGRDCRSVTKRDIAWVAIGGRYFGGIVMRSSLLLASIAVTCIALSGCGQTPGCRALTGAGVGAAGGAVIGAITGAPLAGAAIGAVAGGATGALTSPNVVNGPSPCY